MCSSDLTRWNAARATDGELEGLIQRVLQTLALALAGGTLALLAFELAVRVFLPAFDPSGQFRFAYDSGDGLMLGQPGTVARQRKNTGDYDVAVRINARGLRDDKDVAQARASDTAVVGDSFAWGWGVAPPDRFSDRLRGLTGRRVFNLATPTDLAGYGALLEHAGQIGRAHV